MFSQRVSIETHNITITQATMDTKQLRHKKIVELVEQQVIEREENLVRALAEVGIRVSQSTISKDIKQLGLVKVRHVDGTAQWSLPVQQATPQSLKRLHRVLEDYLFSEIQAFNGHLTTLRVQGTAIFMTFLEEVMHSGQLC
jgi:arginine repressor